MSPICASPTQGFPQWDFAPPPSKPKLAQVGVCQVNPETAHRGRRADCSVWQAEMFALMEQLP